MPRRQHVPDALKTGPITVQAAAAAGLGPDQLRSLNWRRLSRGLYVLTGVKVDLRTHLCALRRRLPDGCAFSHRTAARLLGIDVVVRTSQAHRYEVTAPRDVRLSTSSDLLVRHALLEPADVAAQGELTITTPLRTSFDLARHLPLAEAVAATDALLHRGMVDVSELEAYVQARAGWACVAQARQVLGLAEPASESVMESMLRMVLVGAGCPRPVAQHWISDRHGARIGRVDLWYEQARLAIEYDGEWHRDNLVRDNRRQNQLLDEGIQLLRFTASDVFQRPESIVAQVRTRL